MREVFGQQYQHATTRVVGKASGGDFPLRTFSRVRRRHAIGSDATTDQQGRRDGFVFGSEEAELEIELRMSEWLSLRAWLGQNSDTGAVAQCIFDLPISYGNNINAIKTVTALSCHVTEEAVESSLDGGAIMVTVPVFVTTFDYGTDAPFIAFE